MVDSIDFTTLDLTSEFAKEEELSLTQSQPTTDYDYDTQMSTDLDINYELNLFSQPSQSPSARSIHSSPSQHNQCTNCGAQNTLTDDHISGGKICTNCSHIVQV